MTKELLKIRGIDEALRMAQLTSSLATEVQDLITGMTDTDKVWGELDKRYGDRDITVATAMRKLLQIRLPQGSAHDKGEALSAGVRTAKVCLKAVGAEVELLTSCLIIGTLVKKLDESTQYRWFHYQVTWPEKVRDDVFNE